MQSIEWIAYLKLANSLGPTSKYPDRNEYNAINGKFRFLAIKDNNNTTFNSPKNADFAVMLVVGIHRRLSYSFSEEFKSILTGGSLELVNRRWISVLYSSILAANVHELDRRAQHIEEVDRLC